MASSPATRYWGGGICRLPFFVFALTWTVLIATAAQTIALPLPKTEDEFVAAVRTAIEKEDFAILEEMVLWTDVSPYKRRVIGAQLRHGLGRPIEKMELEHADAATRLDIQKLRGTRLNMPVTYLLRIKFAEERGELGGEPGTVYMVGKLDGVFRIALLVRDADAPAPD